MSTLPCCVFPVCSAEVLELAGFCSFAKRTNFSEKPPLSAVAATKEKN
jgi:hypothetical protein